MGRPERIASSHDHPYGNMKRRSLGSSRGFPPDCEDGSHGFGSALPCKTDGPPPFSQAQKPTTQAKAQWARTLSPHQLFSPPHWSDRLARPSPAAAVLEACPYKLGFSESDWRFGTNPRLKKRARLACRDRVRE